MKTELAVACALFASLAIPGETMTTTGTVSEYVPGTTLVVKEQSGPVNYRYGKKVAYVTKKGTTLTDEEVKTRIKVGASVTVHYSTGDQDRVIERVEIDD